MSHNTYTIDTRPAPKPAASASRRRFQPAWAAVALALACLAAGVYYWKTRPLPLPPVQGDRIVLAKFVGTEQFTRLPLARQEEYVRPLLENRWELLEAVRTGKLSREDAERGLQNAGMIAFNLQARDYFALPTQRQRDAMADQLIDEQERITPFVRALRLGSTSRPSSDTQAHGNSASAAAAGAPAGSRRAADPARIKSRIENTDPLTRARIAEFMGAIKERRENRGLPPMTRP